MLLVSHDERYYHVADRVIKLAYGKVVGVVGDTNHDWLSKEQRPQIYNCYSQ